MYFCVSSTSVFRIRFCGHFLKSFLFLTSSVSGCYDRNMSLYFAPDRAFPNEINHSGNTKRICSLPSSKTALS